MKFVCIIVGLGVCLAPSLSSAQTCGYFNVGHGGVGSSVIGGGCICNCGYSNLVSVECGGSVPSGLDSGTGCHLVDSWYAGITGTCGSSSEAYCMDRCALGPANCGGVTPECCTPAPETCDGRDNDEDGAIDEGVCDDDDTPCEDTRTDPVVVGTGVFTTHPRVDVQFAGLGPQIHFTRHYTSADHWPMPLSGTEAMRIGRGWFHTFDERLYADDARSEATPTSSSTAFILRTASGKGREFDCGGTVNPSAEFTCNPTEGGTDELIWYSPSSVWIHQNGRIRSHFAPDGRLLSRADPSGLGWHISYLAGANSDRIDYVTESATSRRLDFEWELVTPFFRLARLEVDGTVVATFEHDTPGFLTSASNGWDSGMEDYEYETLTVGSSTVTLPHLTRISTAVAGDFVTVS